MKRVVLAAVLALALSACADEAYRSTRHLTPIPPATVALMSEKGVTPGAPILMRSFKKESEIEVWKRKPDGQYAHLKTYPMCRWSGQLGPKTREGDRQAPEGFYSVTPASMNPSSSLFLSFDLGYPNAYDRSHGRTGSHLMVHGSCTSRGCFAMSDEAIAEVYAIARESFAGGQRAFQFQSYPFRMTAENLAKHRADPNIAFWKNLKEGSDHFEVTGSEPTATVSAGRYTFAISDEQDGTGIPAASSAIAEKRRKDEREAAELVAKGTPAVRIVYEDGGGHQSFREIAIAAAGGERFAVLDSRTRNSVGDVSRPEALAAVPREIVVAEVTRKPDEKPAALAFKASSPRKDTKTAMPSALTRRSGPAPAATPKVSVAAAAGMR